MLKVYSENIFTGVYLRPWCTFGEQSIKMLEIQLEPFPILTTEKLKLRQIMREDVHEIFFLRSDKDVLKYLDRDPATSIQDAYQWIDMITDSLKKNDVVTWGVTMRNENKLIGTITFWNIRKEHFRAEIGYTLHPAFQKQGLMQEAMTKVLDYGFNKLNLHSVEANVNPGNAASIRLLEKNNFKREAYFKESWFYNGRFIDSAVYSLINPNS
jgi:RimJ/RimL family protein N-acetyltransferase